MDIPTSTPFDKPESNVVFPSDVLIEIFSRISDIKTLEMVITLNTFVYTHRHRLRKGFMAKNYMLKLHYFPLTSQVIMKSLLESSGSGTMQRVLYLHDFCSLMLGYSDGYTQEEANWMFRCFYLWNEDLLYGIVLCLILQAKMQNLSIDVVNHALQMLRVSEQRVSSILRVVYLEKFAVSVYSDNTNELLYFLKLLTVNSYSLKERMLITIKTKVIRYLMKEISDHYIQETPLQTFEALCRRFSFHRIPSHRSIKEHTEIIDNLIREGITVK
eukprot:TRINITY_DN386_c0_g1_i1.p1 TRINITY_DN386_c0_g1~~TRINITY_DN386_c0_g1_i1.p1  ORF type:complete len:272 (+),score=36.30 TRINITY_DN386_c0_g1_i1:95-910(+)